MSTLSVDAFPEPQWTAKGALQRSTQKRTLHNWAHLWPVEEALPLPQRSEGEGGHCFHHHCRLIGPVEHLYRPSRRWCPRARARRNWQCPSSPWPPWCRCREASEGSDCWGPLHPLIPLQLFCRYWSFSHFTTCACIHKVSILLVKRLLCWFPPWLPDVYIFPSISPRTIVNRCTGTTSCCVPFTSSLHASKNVHSSCRASDTL